MKQAFRYWTVRLQSVCQVITGWLTVDPVSLLSVVNMLPFGLRMILPPPAVAALQIVGGVLFTLSVITTLARVLPEQVKRPS